MSSCAFYLRRKVEDSLSVWSNLQRYPVFVRLFAQITERSSAMTALQRSLPKSAYVDAAWYEREQRAIFWNQWVYAGRAELWPAPGSFRVLDIAGESTIVIRGSDGVLYAHVNLCRHR